MKGAGSVDAGGNGARPGPAGLRRPPRVRTLLHVDLDPFFVSVERSLDPGLRGRPLIVGGSPDGVGVVAAASAEARARGVRAGQPLGAARRLCPEGVLRPGDLDTYARFSAEVTDILVGWSRRVERPSADEACIDLTRDTPGAPNAVTAAEAIKDELQRRLGLDAALGLASSRLAARVASTWARPRGLLIVLGGYEASFLARQPLSFLPDLPPHLEAALAQAGFRTLGDVGAADEQALDAVVGSVARALQDTAAGRGEAPVAVMAAPSRIQEEAVVRDRRSDTRVLVEMAESLAARAYRRLRPFDLVAAGVAVEVRRGEGSQRREQDVEPGIGDEETVRAVAAALAAPLVDPAAGVRAIQVRLLRLTKRGAQASLFPGAWGERRAL